MNLFQKEEITKRGLHEYVCLWPQPSHGAAEVWSCVRASWWRSIRWLRWLWRKKPFQTHRLPRASNSSAYVVLSFKYWRNFWWGFTSTMSVRLAVDFDSESRIPKFVFLCSRLGFLDHDKKSYHVVWAGLTRLLDSIITLACWASFYFLNIRGCQRRTPMRRWLEMKKHWYIIYYQKKVCDVYSFIFLLDFKIKYNLS